MSPTASVGDASCSSGHSASERPASWRPSHPVREPLSPPEPYWASEAPRSCPPRSPSSAMSSPTPATAPPPSRSGRQAARAAPPWGRWSVESCSSTSGGAASSSSTFRSWRPSSSRACGSCRSPRTIREPRWTWPPRSCRSWPSCRSPTPSSPSRTTASPSLRSQHWWAAWPSDGCSSGVSARWPRR